MAQGTPPPLDTVRARRFEVLDTRGRIRAALGPLDDGSDAEDVIGLELRDHDERPRATLGVSTDGPWLVFELDGNLLVHLGINDPARDAVDPGAFLYLSDRLGRPMIGWRITDSGALHTDNS